MAIQDQIQDLHDEMVPLCARCNLSKSDSLPLEWLVEKFDKRKANKIMQRVTTFFATILLDADSIYATCTPEAPVKNRLVKIAIQRGVAVDAMMESMLARNMTVREMADDLGVAQGTIHLWLRKNDYRPIEVIRVKWRKKDGG